MDGIAVTTFIVFAASQSLVGFRLKLAINCAARCIRRRIPLRSDWRRIGPAVTELIFASW